MDPDHTPPRSSPPDKVPSADTVAAWLRAPVTLTAARWQVGLAGLAGLVLLLVALD